jgi:hypothetical protein
MAVVARLGTQDRPLTGAVTMYNPVRNEYSHLAGDSGSADFDLPVKAVHVQGTAQVEGGFVINGLHRHRLSLFTLPSAEKIKGGSLVLVVVLENGETVKADGWIEPTSVEKIVRINSLYPKLKVADPVVIEFAKNILADPAKKEWHGPMQKLLDRVHTDAFRVEPEVPVTGVVDVLGVVSKVQAKLNEALELLKGIR